MHAGMYRSMYISTDVCFFGDCSGQEALTVAKVVAYDKTVDNILLGHIYSAVGFPAKA